MSEEKKPRAKEVDRLKRPKRVIKNDPLDKIIVQAKYWCGVCTKFWFREERQSIFRRLPRGARRPDGSINRMCQTCIPKFKKNLERELKTMNKLDPSYRKLSMLLEKLNGV